MGFMNWIKSKILQKEIKKIQQKSPVEASLDEYIADAMKRHAASQRTAEKMLKVKMLDKQTKDTYKKLEELDSDDDEDYDDDEDQEDFGDRLIKDLISQFVKSRSPQQQDFLVTGEPSPNDITALAAKLTPEQKKMINKKFGLDL